MGRRSIIGEALGNLAARVAALSTGKLVGGSVAASAVLAGAVTVAFPPRDHEVPPAAEPLAATRPAELPQAGAPQRQAALPAPARVASPPPPAPESVSPPPAVEAARESPAPPTARTPDPAPVAPAPPPSQAKAPFKPSPQPEMRAKAEEYLDTGDVTSARLWLETASDKGDPEATFRLAETYDPGMLGTWGVVGMSSDPHKARDLYRKALAMGVEDARDRVARLGP